MNPVRGLRQKEVYLYKRLKDNKAQCRNCAYYCLVLPGEKGGCRVRENIDGKLFVLNYGKIIARDIDPIEKKPFFHFLPGTKSYSIASIGCNFSCLNCQNYTISQASCQAPKIWGEDLLPEEIVEHAIKNNCPSIAYTYTEPTIFLEFALDTMKIAKKKGLKNVWVSNGFMSPESAKLIIPYLDANNIDIKSFSDAFYRENCHGRLQPVLDTAKLMKKSGVWVEITTLAIPNLSDSGEMFYDIAKFIYHELGPETPWHISQFSGALSWKLHNLPDTPRETLNKAFEIGKETGLKYVYTGNAPGLSSEDTLCPKCGAIAIDRMGYMIIRYDKQGRCPKCSQDLNLILK